MNLLNALLPLLLALAFTAPAVGQVEADPLGSRPRLYVGGGFGPGVGVVVAGSQPALTLFTREAVLYADYVPRVTGGSGRLVTAIGVGGSIRLVRVLDVAQNRQPGPFDVDVGVRVGPSFYTAFFEQSAESRSRAFSVMLDPFARLTLRRSSGLVLFGEAGSQSPSFRVGLSASLR